MSIYFQTYTCKKKKKKKGRKERKKKRKRKETEGKINFALTAGGLCIFVQ